MTTRGLVLGKFMPPHLGHVYLVDFAREYVDELTVVVGTLAREPIAGERRFRWMREMFPSANVVHLTDENPQEPHEHPQFWDIWRESLLRVAPKPDFVFASESYGERLAKELGAAFIPVDLARAQIPVSGTAIRDDPMTNWRFIPRCVRPHFVRRVCVVGPESTGKTTLAAALAKHFDTTWVPEYARTLLEPRANDKDSVAPVRREDMVRIARGQIASEEALARNASRVIIADTDALATLLWSDLLFGDHDAELEALASSQSHHLYVLTAPDVPFVADAVRYAPKERAAFFDAIKRELERRNRPFVIASGDWESRQKTAVIAIESLLDRARSRR